MVFTSERAEGEGAVQGGWIGVRQPGGGGGCEGRGGWGGEGIGGERGGGEPVASVFLLASYFPLAIYDCTFSQLRRLLYIQSPQVHA